VYTLEDIRRALWADDCVYSKDPPAAERRAMVAALLAEEECLERAYWAQVRYELSELS
jgi:hypothetical protein